MFRDIIEEAKQLVVDKEPFAMAMVVRREIPSSGKPGDRAVIRKDGSMLGWIGGGCTRGIILKEAHEAIAEGKPRLVRISPKGELLDQHGVKEYKMTCHSGGTVEVYIDPVIPKPNVIIMGKSHVAMALSKIARSMDYSVAVVSPGADAIMFPTANTIIDGNQLDEQVLTPNSYIVVCTQGEGDEIAMQQALKGDHPYVGFVASRKKANAIFNYLRKTGTPIETLQAVKTPCGLDINAKTPEEVAVSILAEIIQYHRGEEKQSGHGLDMTQNDDIFINPVCQVPVQKSSAKHIIEHKGELYYFCCDGCKVSFEKEPDKYALAK
ncbi:MAG: XdhC family protein [Bacteroidota bacterium]